MKNSDPVIDARVATLMKTQEDFEKSQKTDSSKDSDSNKADEE